MYKVLENNINKKKQSPKFGIRWKRGILFVFFFLILEIELFIF